jgi:hypothetical protein
MKLDAKLNTIAEGNANRCWVIAVSVRLVENARIPSGELMVPIQRVSLVHFKQRTEGRRFRALADLPERTGVERRPE